MKQSFIIYHPAAKLEWSSNCICKQVNNEKPINTCGLCKALLAPPTCCKDPPLFFMSVCKVFKKFELEHYIFKANTF